MRNAKRKTKSSCSSTRSQTKHTIFGATKPLSMTELPTQDVFKAYYELASSNMTPSKNLYFDV